MSDDLWAEDMDEDQEEYMLDEVSGRKRKSVMSLLNKTKLNKYEMDDILVKDLFEQICFLIYLHNSRKTFKYL